MTATFYVGDALEVMATLPAESVDLVLSSPPFLALRSYLPADHPDKKLEGGSQATPGAYIDWLVDVVEACARILAPHGSMCIELGDTYAGSGGAGGDYAESGLREGQPTFGGGAKLRRIHEPEKGPPIPQRRDWAGSTKGPAWPLAKSLSLIPELFRLTLVYGINPLTGRTTERWRLRNVIRWVRPNPPVGALGDKFRPATSELMVFCKSAKRFFDLDAVREPWKDQEQIGRTSPGYRYKPEGGYPDQPETRIRQVTGNGAPPLDWWNIPPGGYAGAHYAVWPPELCVKPIKAMSPEKICRTCGEPSRPVLENMTAARRSRTPDPSTIGGILQGHRRLKGYTVRRVAELVGADYDEAAHWFRSDAGARLPDPKQWFTLTTIFDLPFELIALMAVTPPDYPAVDYGNRSIPRRLSGGPPADGIVKVYTTRYSDCGHDDWRPGLVLDPFVGSGTTLAVATGHGRDAIGIDLDERNYQLALERVGPLILQRGEVAA